MTTGMSHPPLTSTRSSCTPDCSDAHATLKAMPSPAPITRSTAHTVNAMPVPSQPAPTVPHAEA